MDYKNRIPGYRPPRQPKKKDRTGLWATVAVLVGLAVVAAGFVFAGRNKESSPATTPAATSQPDKTVTSQPLPNPTDKPKVKPDEPKEAVSTAPATATPPAPFKPVEPRFTFYKILPEQEAIITENEIKALKKEEGKTKKGNTGHYNLGAGSYPNAQDADKLKAKLSSLKVKSHVESVKIDNTTWNRVKIGPFKSVADADKVRTYLKDKGLDSVVQKPVNKPVQEKPKVKTTIKVAPKPAPTATPAAPSTASPATSVTSKPATPPRPPAQTPTPHSAPATASKPTSH